jgi:hypothetical protein
VSRSGAEKATGALARPRSRSDRSHSSAQPDTDADRAAAGSRGPADGGAAPRAAGAHERERCPHGVQLANDDCRECYIEAHEHGAQMSCGLHPSVSLAIVAAPVYAALLDAAARPLNVSWDRDELARIAIEAAIALTDAAHEWMERDAGVRP